MKNAIKNRKKVKKGYAKMTMMIMQWKICKENDFMSFCAKVDFLGQGLTFGQLLTFVDFFF
jgi:hypothetical protein